MKGKLKWIMVLPEAKVDLLHNQPLKTLLHHGRKCHQPIVFEDPIIKRKKAQQCSVMKSVVHIHERTKPLAFTFVPTVQRLPAHVHVVDSRIFLQMAKEQNPVTSSSGMNEPLGVTEESSRDVRLKETIVQGPSSQMWLSPEGRIGSAEGAEEIQGIFKAEIVQLTDSNGTDHDCFSREAGVDVSVHALPSLNLPQNPFSDDKDNFVHPNVVGDESNVLLLRDADQKTDGALQESLFQFKIKSSYKAFAAIPTNTLLWEQKAIDEAVSVSGDSVGQNTSEEAHSQFLFEPESLRQQSEELYAVIDQVLEDPLPMRHTSSAPDSSPRLPDLEGHKPIGRIPKSAGRETKYANLHLPSSESTEKRSTRPGVIRPVTVIQKLPATPKLEDNCPNPFRHHSDETNDTEIKEWHFPLSAILTSAPYPSVCNEMYQTTPRSQDIPQSVPLSLSPVTCLTSGSHIRFSPIVPYNYYMISNLSRSLHSLYIKPRHAITTIHENEALGITELVNATTKPIKDQFQKEGSEPGSGRSPMDVPDSGEEALMISQEDKEQGIK
ncbi:uncharacterized protein mlip isoform X8 [Narcine bancroftii]|uniref:uncharacterized protein mlip isoform X8 n=1 Tax=Narcine bancroftii TaxID=1343680 RepID=UPI0038315C14